MDYNETIKKFDLIYQNLSTKWEIVKNEVEKHQSDLKIESYLISYQSDREIHFSIFGMKCYMELGFILKNGMIDSGIIFYGVLSRNQTTCHEERKVVTEVEFDQNGDVTHPNCLALTVNEYRKVHAFILSATIGDIVKLSQPKPTPKEDRCVVC